MFSRVGETAFSRRGRLEVIAVSENGENVSGENWPYFPIRGTSNRHNFPGPPTYGGPAGGRTVCQMSHLLLGYRVLQTVVLIRFLLLGGGLFASSTAPSPAGPPGRRHQHTSSIPSDRASPGVMVPIARCSPVGRKTGHPLPRATRHRERMDSQSASRSARPCRSDTISPI